MYHTISEFILDWEHEKAFTQKILDNITDDSLKFSSSDQGRNIARLAWHIVTSLVEMGKSAGLQFDNISADASVPDKADAIKQHYKLISDKLQTYVLTQWSDESLSEVLNMYGEMWKKSFILEVVVKHQIHHRGQLTMLMRQAGLRVPGVYGPSYEEWKSMGMAPQE